MKKLFLRGESEEWSDLIDQVFTSFLKSDEAKQLDNYKYQQVIMLYRATERAFYKAYDKQEKKLQKKYDEVQAAKV